MTLCFKILRYFVLLLVCITTPAPAEVAALFDGKTFNGWEGDAINVWRIEHGEIVAGRPDFHQPRNDFLCTTREFGDFDLRVKYKRDKNNGGIQFRSQRVPGSREVAGYQADFYVGIDGFLYDESRRRTFLAQPDAETIAKLKLGDWNSYRIRAEGPHIRMWLNDVLTVDYTEQDPAIPLRGIIGLQIHAKATEIRYKDLVIEELDTKPASKNLTSSAWGPESGFQSLFNGKDLSGWHYKDEPELKAAINATDERYSAKDGMLVVNPENTAKGPHLRQLWTIQEFPDDFILKLEFRASVNADSGIFIRGPQLQCRDYWVAGPYKNLKKYKPQDWNEIEVTVQGGTAFCTCNGEIIEKEFKVPPTGPIGLEADRAKIEYRNIQLKTLDTK
jgi:hypothetical protein